MKTRFLLVLAMAICFVSMAAAQTKASGTLSCAKPDPVNSFEVGDKPGHLIVLDKTACTWPKPMDIGGMQSKEGTSAELSEANGGKSMGGGIHWGTVEGGDRYFVKFTTSAALTKEGALQTASGTWKYTGGSGKLKGLKGGGSFKGTGNADGSATFEVEGEWSLPAAKAPAKK